MSDGATFSWNRTNYDIEIYKQIDLFNVACDSAIFLQLTQSKKIGHASPHKSRAATL